MHKQLARGKTAPRTERKSKKQGFAPKWSNPRLLADTLVSRADVNWLNTPPSKLFQIKLNHHAFSGIVLTLMHKAFQIPNRAGAQLTDSEDMRAFLWYVFEERMIANDNQKLEEQSVLGRELIGSFSDPDNYERMLRVRAMGQSLGNAIEHLTERETQVLNMRFGENKTLEEVGKAMGVSHERVRHIQNRGLDRMRPVLALEDASSDMEAEVQQPFSAYCLHHYEYEFGIFVDLQLHPISPNIRARELERKEVKELENALTEFYTDICRANTEQEIWDALNRAGFLEEMEF